MEPTPGQGNETPPAEATPEISAELDRLTALDPTALDDAAKQTLQQNYDFLTDEERTKFGIQAPAPAQQPPAQPPKPEKIRTRNEAPRGSNSDFSKDPLYKRMLENQVNIEVNQIVSQNESMKPLEGEIKRYAQNPAYEQVPVDFIAKALAFDAVQKELVELRNNSEAGGNGIRPAAPAGRPGGTVRTSGGGKKNWSDMPNDEFDSYVNKVKNGETVNA